MSVWQHREVRWRPAFWAVAAALLLAPLFAMLFTTEVNWGLGDFALFGALLLAAGTAYEVTVRSRLNTVYRAAVALALVSAFVLAWINLTVGIAGDESDPVNMLYYGVLAIGLVGALIARARPRAMAYTMLVTALAQGLAAMIAGSVDAAVLSAIFIALWLTAAGLFWKASRPSH